MDFQEYSNLIVQTLTSKLGVTPLDVVMSIKSFSKDMEILSDLFQQGKPVDEAIEDLMIIKPKFQVRGIFAPVSKSGITNKCNSFCFDVDVSFYEAKDILKSKNKAVDINLSEFVKDKIDETDIGISKQGIVILTMELWCNEYNKGWFIVK